MAFHLMRQEQLCDRPVALRRLLEHNSGGVRPADRGQLARPGSRGAGGVAIKPATTSTPLFTNSRNKMDRKPKGPPPIYAPSVVAACVEYAAEHPVRDLFAGGGGKQMVLSQFFAPRLMDRVMARLVIRSETAREKVPGGSPGNLDHPSDDDRTAGDYRGRPQCLHLVAVASAGPPSCHGWRGSRDVELVPAASPPLNPALPRGSAAG